jgi:hypothetical protein
MQMPNTKELLASAVIVFVVFVAAFVWPSAYRYDRLNTLPVRINRFTGTTEVLTGEGWKVLQQSGNLLAAGEAALPPAELVKIEGEMRRTGYGYLECEIYNGSGWEAKELTVIFVTTPAGGQTRTRKYRLMPEYLSAVQPYNSGTFKARLEPSDQGTPTWIARIDGAVGTPSHK